MKKQKSINVTIVGTLDISKINENEQRAFYLSLLARIQDARIQQEK